MLNAMGVGALDAPRAERVLRISDTGEPDRPHHVADPEGSSDRAGPTRPRAPDPGPHREHPLPGELWMLAVVHPGDPAGRPARPLDDERPGPRVRRHRRRPRGRVAWLPHPVGPAMQWRLARAERPLPPPTPGEAATALNAQVLVSARELAGLDAAAGRRPDDAASVVLGGAYPTGTSACSTGRSCGARSARRARAPTTRRCTRTPGWPARRTCAGSGPGAARRPPRPPAGRTRGRRAPVSERWGRRGGAPGAARPRRAAGARTTVTVRSARPAGGAADRFGDGQGRSDPRSRPVTPGALRRRSRTGRRRRG